MDRRNPGTADDAAERNFDEARGPGTLESGETFGRRARMPGMEESRNSHQTSPLLSLHVLPARPL
jgi:hypothetical protein